MRLRQTINGEALDLPPSLVTSPPRNADPIGMPENRTVSRLELLPRKGRNDYYREEKNRR